MDHDLKKLKKLTKFMQKEGILSLKLPEIELSLSPQAVFKDESPTPLPNTPEQLNDTPVDPLETLLWSAPGFMDENEEAH